MARRKTFATYVLIHGAGDVGWYWHLVEAELRTRGHDVVVMDLPVDDDSAGLSTYADVVIDAIGERENLVVVAQSFGGYVAPIVCDRVRARLLVLVAAMVPSPGESAEDLFANTGYASPERVDSSDLAIFYHDVDPALAAEALAKGRRQSATPGKEPWPLAAWPDVPTRYLLCRNDRLFPPEWVRRVVRDRLGIIPDEMDSGHTPALSHPRELVQRLEAYRADSSMVSIVPYDERWPGEFDGIAAMLRGALGAHALSVDHIGSTSVPNLSAKDIIDIQVTVREFAPAISNALLDAGFVLYSEATADHVPPGFDDVPGDWSKWLFLQPRGQRRVNIHVRQANKPNQRYALLVRDFLRANPEVAAAYAELKSRLAAALADPADYPQVKDPAVDLLYFAASTSRPGQEQAVHSHHAIDYIEFTVRDLTAAKRFYTDAFGWKFTDYGPDYAGIRGADGEVGGLHQTDEVRIGGPLVVLYSNDLDQSLVAVRSAGGKVVREPFAFPGGRRFHFADPSGNELAVWSDV